MLGHRFSKYTPPPDDDKSDFERLLKVFMQLILITSGNVSEALQWLTEVDKQYKLTNDQYGIGDFIDGAECLRLDFFVVFDILLELRAQSFAHVINIGLGDGQVFDNLRADFKKLASNENN